MINSPLSWAPRAIIFPLILLGVSWSLEQAESQNIVFNGDFSSAMAGNSGSVTPGSHDNNWTRPGGFRFDIDGTNNWLFQADETGAEATVQAINDGGSSTGLFDLSFDYLLEDGDVAGTSTFYVQVYGVNTNTGSWSFSNWSANNATLSGDATSVSLYDQTFMTPTTGWENFSAPGAVDLGTGYEYVVIRIGDPDNSFDPVFDTIQIDNFSLTAVPEPSIAGLMALALTGLLIKRRRG